MAVYRVSREELAKAAKEEQKEHPWASPNTARRIARDHLREHPKYQTVMPIAEKMMQQRERNIKPIRHHQMQRPVNPFAKY